ncbi:hypothetical protein ACFU99_35980 [Streptomyces sp. NPDC057654]|uniref:hypothetical protein n=1 Tax=Streptomyces sp. NPDC057654 TaxID=3346196 RepID=UPI0036D138E6
MSDTAKRRLALWGPVIVAGATAAGYTVVLHRYDLPVHLLLACAALAWAAMHTAARHVADAWVTTTYGCDAPGCDFSVSVSHASAGECRRWQETAANHPDHQTY